MPIRKSISSSILHPFLLAIYPIIFLYSHNIQETSIKETYLPLVIAISCSIILYLITKIIVKDKYKASLIATIFISIFYTYGYFFDWIVSLDMFWVKHRHILPMTLVGFGYLAYFVTLIKNPKKTTAILNIIAITLIGVNIANIIPAEIKNYEFQDTIIKNQKEKNENLTSNQAYPDIYYIVLDEYASFDTIKNIWGYDNSKFKKYLQDKKFIVIENSTIDIAKTLYSMSTSLNMEKPEFNTPELIDNNFKKIQYDYHNNAVMEYLRKRNYNIEVLQYMSKLFSFEQWPQQKPLQFSMNSNKFSSIIIKNSILKPFEYKLEKNESNTFASITMFILEELKDTNLNINPTFVYAHLVCPHTPFIFNKDGSITSNEKWFNWEIKDNYLNQYIYITNEIKKVIDILMQKHDSIIIIQSDHGPRGNELFQIPENESKKILLAIYLPGIDTLKISESLPPEDIFKIIFNNYFNENFKLSKN